MVQKLSKRGPVPPALVSQAHAGSPEKISQLGAALTPGSCTVAILNVAIKHLDTPLIPNAQNPNHANSPRYISILARALPSFAIFAHVLEDASHNQELSEAVVVLVLPMKERLFRWVDFWLESGMPCGDYYPGENMQETYCQMAAVLLRLVALDVRVQDAFVSLPRYASLVLKIWSGRSADGSNRFLADLDCPAGGCSILRLLKSCILDHSGRDALVDHLAAGHKAAETMTFTLVERAHQLCDACDDTQAPDRRVIAYLDGIFEIADVLIPRSASLRACMEKGRYLLQFTMCLDAISAAIDNRNPPHQPDLISPLTRLLQLIIDRKTATVAQTWRDAIAGGFIDVLHRILFSVADSKGEHSPVAAGTAVLDMLGRCTVYPKVLMALAKAGAIAKPGTRRSSHPQISLAADEFWKSFGDRARVYGSAAQETKISICDNIKCAKRLLPPPAQGSKACANCGMAIYCSKACQKEDWNLYHREECPDAKVFRRTMKADKSWYSHASREFHAALIEDAYNRFESEINKRAVSSFPKHSFAEVLPTFQFRTPTLEIDVRSIRGKMRSVHPSQDVIKRRMLSLMLSYKGERLSRDMRLVEAEFPLGIGGAVNLMTLVQPSEGRYKVVYTVPLYSTVVES